METRSFLIAVTNNCEGRRPVYMHIEQIKRFVTTFPLEAIIWFSGLVILACADPVQDAHISLCPIAYLGYDFCPGCGLGRSITLLFHGSLDSSLRTHPLGIIAAGMLIQRTVQLTNNHRNRIWQK